jgi:midasin (ATPase involved in ribosome maturation)
MAHTPSSLRLMGRLLTCVTLNEPVLLVSETGTGKTSMAGYLATLLGTRLVAVNMSQQTESTDFLGGFKPVKARTLALPLKNTVEDLFSATFPVEKSVRFLDTWRRSFVTKQWPWFCTLPGGCVAKAINQLQRQLDRKATTIATTDGPAKKRHRRVAQWPAAGTPRLSAADRARRCQASRAASAVPCDSVHEPSHRCWQARSAAQPASPIHRVRGRVARCVVPGNSRIFCRKVAGFHMAARQLSEAHAIVDGANHRPH